MVDALERAAGKPQRKSKSQVHRKPITSYGLYEEEGRAAFNDAIARVATLLLKSHIEEQGHIAMAVLRMGLDAIGPKQFDKIDNLLDDFTSWSIVDDFATGKASITAVLLARYPKETLALHERWLTSPNQWKRRTSVVTFTRIYLQFYAG